MTTKIRVGILFGGKSAEHEISLRSARSVAEAINRNKYEVVLIGINKQGSWFLSDAKYLLETPTSDHSLETTAHYDRIAPIPGKRDAPMYNFTQRNTSESVDVIFPVLHGPYGEDGTVQGLLKLVDIPFVGAGVLGSAIGMDKDVTKRLLQEAGIPVARFIALTRKTATRKNFNELAELLKVPFFVKPANLGSSVGIRKIATQKQYKAAVDEAFSFDTKILVEECIIGREIECSVLGNEDPIASIPGEIIPQHDFYSYEAKYIDADGALLKIPAPLPEPLVQKIQQLALRTFETLCCEGMARIDMFLTQAENLLVNEINTIPGFTSISMYPKLWAASGITYGELIDRLIQLALERHERDKKLKTTYTAQE